MSETTEEFEIDFDAELSIEDLLNYAKLFSGLVAEDEACLKNIAPLVTPHLAEITDSFYAHLNNIPQAASFIKGRVEKLKVTHLNWLTSLFNQNIDINFVTAMYKTGDTHVKVHLPIEFMVGAMTLMNNDLIKLMFKLFPDNPQQCMNAIKAINAVTGLSLMLMLYSFHVLTNVAADS
jgi:hypothetical protein